MWENATTRMMARRRRFLSQFLLLLLCLPGCLSPIAMHRAVLAYDETVSQVEAEMMLLNIARAKQGFPIHFTAVSNVAATFDFRTTAGLGGQIFEMGGTSAAKNFYSFNLGASVAENPTVSIIPIQGEEFTKRLLIPMDETKFEFLVNQGIEPAIVLRLMARGVGVEHGESRAFFLNLPHQPEEYAEFRRRILHLSSLSSARQLHVGVLEYEEVWPLPADHPLTAQAFDHGYRWLPQGPEGVPVLSKKVLGRVAITNYDPAKLSRKERRHLQEEAEQYPINYVFVDIRPEHPGGTYPWRGQIKLRSFSAMIDFIARGIGEEPEFAVRPDPRSGPVARNPAATLQIVESSGEPSDAVLTVSLNGRWYAIEPDSPEHREAQSWNREAFRFLTQLYQMTVTDVGRVPTLPITIAK